MNRNIKILLASSIFLHIGMNLLAPIWAIFIGKINGNMIDAGSTVAFFILVKGLLYLFFDKIRQKRFSQKQMIMAGYFLFGVGYFCYMFADSIWHIFIIQAILAMGETVVTPSWSAVIACSLDKGKEAKNYSDFYAYRSFFEAGSALLGGYLAFNFGFNIIFFLMGIMAVCASALSYFIDTTKTCDIAKMKIDRKRRKKK